MFCTLRILIGSIFIASSVGKLLAPYQNFLYMVQAYELLPSWAEVLVAQVLPWMEIMIGVFLVAGLWTSWALRGAVLLFGIFVVVLGQALLRGLPLESCGCFGAGLHLKPQTVLILDSLSLIITFLLLRNPASTQRFSLDSYFNKS